MKPVCWRRTPRLVLCTGMASSGSTWLFNAVAELLRVAAGGKAIAQFFADKFEGFPDRALECDYLVVKNHEPHKTLIALATLTDAPILMTIREPKDAVASLMTRFSMSFEEAERSVRASGRALARVSRNQTTMLLRYEEGFFDKVGTVRKIASCLGLRVSGTQAKTIFDRLTPQQIRRKIETLRETGAFEKGVTPATQYDPVTHWHPGHIGDGEIGKFRNVLSPEQQAAVTNSTRLYRREFGYSAASGSGNHADEARRSLSHSALRR